MKSKQVTYHLGNVLMLAGIGLILFIYYPFILLFLIPQKLQNYSNKPGFFIQIPKINAQAPLVANVDPWNESEYLKKLRGGVAIAKSTAIPGDEGTTSYLFSHSSDVPWDITQYNTAFFRLGEVKNGDEIKIFENGRELDYKVYNELTIWPNNVKYLKDAITDKSKTNILILQTCTPIGTDFQRLLLFAKKI